MAIRPGRDVDNSIVDSPTQTMSKRQRRTADVRGNATTLYNPSTSKKTDSHTIQLLRGTAGSFAVNKRLARLLQQIFLPDAPILPHLESQNPALPFVVRAVSTTDELLTVARLRLSVYRVAAKGEEPPLESALDVEDFAANSQVLAAIDKETNEMIGTMRIAFSSRGPTTMEQLISLPEPWRHAPYAEARLLCVPKSENSRMVLLMLCKTFFKACRIEGVDNIIIGARRAMEPFYRILCFEDVSDPPMFFSPAANNMPHRILALRVSQLEQIWPQHDFTENLRRMFFVQQHEDIRLGRAAPLINPLSGMHPPSIAGKAIVVQPIARLAR